MPKPKPAKPRSVLELQQRLEPIEVQEPTYRKRYGEHEAEPPTPEEIAERAAAIRQEWRDGIEAEERLHRHGGRKKKRQVQHEQ